MDSTSTETKRPSEIRLRDPLSDVTRAERKTLLGVSAIGLIIAKSGLVPSKISALGVDFDRADQTAILRMLSAVVVYFLLAFMIYSAADLIAWRVSFHNDVFDRFRDREVRRIERGAVEDTIDAELREVSLQGYRWSIVAKPMSVIRAIFEFAVPIVVGVYAFVALAHTPAPKTSIKVATSTSIPVAPPSSR